ncbi:MAG: hydroxymethylbilane synthase [Candidatus Margulisiibacteriota bacterium]
MTPIRLGTRGSALALIQANRVKTELEAAFPGTTVEIHIIKTEGDRNQTSLLSQIGGKGVFIRDIETALVQNTIDIAVHSLKDITSTLLPGLVLGGFLKPESRLDALVCKGNYTLDTLPTCAVVGTGAARRVAQLSMLCPDLNTKPIRGNVETRLAKLADPTQGLDAILLSEAGLIRLNLTHHITQTLSPEEFLPAPGQGVIALEHRSDDAKAQHWCAALSDPTQTLLSQTELAFLSQVGLDCASPLGLYATLEKTGLRLRGFLAHHTPGKTWRCDETVPIENGLDLAQKMAQEALDFLDT